jgi:hypothetical protein
LLAWPPVTVAWAQAPASQPQANTTPNRRSNFRPNVTKSLAAARAQPAVPPKSGLWCAPMFLNMVSATVAPGACGEQLCPPPNSHPLATVKGASLLPKGALPFSDIWQHTLFLHAHQRWGGHPHNLICGESSDFLLSVGAQSWGDCLTRCRETRPTKPFHNVLIS